jgi:hypothetical protein
MCGGSITDLAVGDAANLVVNGLRFNGLRIYGLKVYGFDLVFRIFLAVLLGIRSKDTVNKANTE